jgi:O-acetyl-ADP-ribose deacetylase (regulator of RNase III)
MPITFRTGDLLTSDAQALINTVNCVGVMGKGLALEFRKRYPLMFEDYVERCKAGRVRTGEPYLYRDTLIPPWIINFPTKQHWRGKSKMEYIDSGLRYLVPHLGEWGVSSVAVPPLGCGHGGLRWTDVRPRVEAAFDQTMIEVTVYEPPARRSAITG